MIEPGAPGKHVYSALKLPRLGAILLATIARDLGWEARVYVEDIAPIDYQDVLTADLVGISTITSTADRAYAIADALRDYEIPIAMGGPHVTFLTDEALEHADFVVRGEAEEAFPMLLNLLLRGGDLSVIPNLSYRNELGECRHNPQTSTIEDLDSLPYPDFHLIAGWKRAKGFVSQPIFPIMTSRGCPYGCKFCSVVGMFGRRMRFRSIENVIGELEQNADPGMHVFFYDDNFTANTKRTKKLLREGLIGKGLCKDWSTQVRAEAAFDGELMDLMKQAGCSHVYIGFETVNPVALEKMEKKQTVEQMKEAVGILHRHDIEVHGMFVFGFDSDNRQTLRATTKFAKQSGIRSVQFMILTPLPGTPLFDDLKAAGRLTNKDWSYYDAHHVTYKPQAFSPWELQWAQLKGHAMFYSRRRLLQLLLRGKLASSALYVYARRVNHDWKRSNRIYLKAIKLAGRAKGIRLSFDFEFDFSEIKRQVQNAAAALALPQPA